jgi:hypothetical protein
LFEHGTSADPARLAANQFSFIGCDVKGQGFLFDDDDPEATPLSEMERLLSVRRENSQRIRPYMSGEDLNNSPDLRAHRFVIDFAEMSLEETKRFPDLLDIVQRKVLPERLTKSKELAEWPWWRFWRTRMEMRAAVSSLERMLVTAQTGNAQAFVLLSTAVIPSHSVVVVASDSLALFAVLQSQAHQHWSAFFGPSLKDDRRYAPSDCFETFPFPQIDSVTLQAERVGSEYYRFRADVMLRTGRGLTAIYNRFHDPNELDSDITKLRDLHIAMDRVVLDAYGWRDIQPTCRFILDYEDEEEDTPGAVSRRKKPWRYRWPDEIRDEVLGRLLELNAQRAKEEESAGKGSTSTRAPKAPKAAKKRKAADTPLLDG